MQKAQKRGSLMKVKGFYSFIETWLIAEIRKISVKPVIVAISGPQGCGKSTLSAELTRKFSQRGLRSETVSIDDFYLTRNEQERLAINSGNPYLQSRGYPGTHDVNLGSHLLQKLQQGAPCKIPVYDKSKYGGRGDRAPVKEWKAVDDKQDVIIFEGWMLGFIPQKNIESLHLKEVNSLLEPYQQWLDPVHIFLHLKANDITNVIDWRVEAEQKMRASGKDSMTDREAKDYITSFLPAYKLYDSTIENRRSEFSVYKTVEVGKDRLPIGLKE